MTQLKICSLEKRAKIKKAISLFFKLVCKHVVQYENLLNKK